MAGEYAKGSVVGLRVSDARASAWDPTSAAAQAMRLSDSRQQVWGSQITPAVLALKPAPVPQGPVSAVGAVKAGEQVQQTYETMQAKLMEARSLQKKAASTRDFGERNRLLVAAKAARNEAALISQILLKQKGQFVRKETMVAGQLLSRKVGGERFGVLQRLFQQFRVSRPSIPLPQALQITPGTLVNPHPPAFAVRDLIAPRGMIPEKKVMRAGTSLGGLGAGTVVEIDRAFNKAIEEVRPAMFRAGFAGLGDVATKDINPATGQPSLTVRDQLTQAATQAAIEASQRALDKFLPPPPTAAGQKATAAGTILGLPATTFYVVAGVVALGVGALVLRRR